MSLGRLTADLLRIRASLVGYSQRGCALLASSAACTSSVILGRPMNHPGWGRIAVEGVGEERQRDAPGLADRLLAAGEADGPEGGQPLEGLEGRQEGLGGPG